MSSVYPIAVIPPKKVRTRIKVPFPTSLMTSQQAVQMQGCDSQLLNLTRNSVTSVLGGIIHHRLPRGRKKNWSTVRSHFKFYKILWHSVITS